MKTSTAQIIARVNQYLSACNRPNITAEINKKDLREYNTQAIKYFNSLKPKTIRKSTKGHDINKSKVINSILDNYKNRCSAIVYFKALTTPYLGYEKVHKPLLCPDDEEQILYIACCDCQIDESEYFCDNHKVELKSLNKKNPLTKYRYTLNENNAKYVWEILGTRNKPNWQNIEAFWEEKCCILTEETYTYSKQLEIVENENTEVYDFYLLECMKHFNRVIKEYAKYKVKEPETEYEIWHSITVKNVQFFYNCETCLFYKTKETEGYKHYRIFLK